MHSARIVVFSVALAASVGCFAMNGNESSTQCRSEEDCRNRGPAFANTTCSAARVCVPVPAEADLCSTNQECVDKNGGSPFRCVPSTHKCVAITSAECTRIFGEASDYLDNNAVFVGMLTLNDEAGALMEAGVELARRQIRQTLGGGLPPVTAGGPKRPLVIVDCAAEPNARGVGTSAGATRAARHLVDELEVSAMVGPFTPPTILNVVPSQLLQNDVPTFLTATATPASIRELEDKGILFQLSGLDTDTVAILPQFYTNVLEPRLRSSGIAPPEPAPIRVHLIRMGDAAVVNQGNWILQNLRWNGKSANENQTDGNLLVSSTGDLFDNVNVPDGPQRVTRAIAQGLAFKPHLVLFSTPPGFAGTTIVPYDTQWNIGTNGPKPIFVSTMQAWPNTIVNAIGNRNDLRMRFYGLENTPPNLDKDRYDRFVIEIRGDFPELTTQNIGSQAYAGYDAVYMLTYAAVAAGATELRGPAIGNAARRLGTGNPITTGTDDLTKGIAAVQGGGTIDLIGISGRFEFDERGRRPPFNSTVFCVTANAQNVANGIFRPAYELNAKTGAVTGAGVCP